MSTKTSRRAVLAGVAALPAVIAGPAVATAAVEIQQLEALWRRRTSLHARAVDLMERYKAAKSRLPPWAQSGPAYVNSRGERVGPMSGWPELAKFDLPPHEDGHLPIRPSIADVREQLRSHVSLFGRRGPGGSSRLAKLKAVRARLAEKRAEYKRLGIDKISEEIDAVSIAQGRVDDRIREIEPTIDSIAAVALIESNFADSGDDSNLTVLRHLESAVRSPMIAADVSRALQAVEEADA